jgi:beta-xylosidase
VLVYATRDLERWDLLGVALDRRGRPRGIEFRPHVVFNRKTQKYVMWYEDRPPPQPGHPFASAGYNVASANSPDGPFVTISTGVKVADVPGDFDILVDEDGTAYHIQTTTNDPNASRGFAITVLDDTYTKPLSPHRGSTFDAPKPAEGPVFFKRSGSYYVLGGTTCCACKGGASIYVFRSSSPLGPWRYVGDVGSTHQTFNPHSPNNYVTRAQASTVFEAPVGSGQLVWLGNQWVSSVGSLRNSDLLYWSILQFTPSGDVKRFQWSPNCTV